jgi:hypothetical protein
MLSSKCTKLFSQNSEGNVNTVVEALRQDKDAIRNELEYKMQPLTSQRGTVFGLDHRIPDGIPIDNYRYYVETAREILGLPVGKSGEWQRMAFLGNPTIIEALYPYDKYLFAIHIDPVLFPSVLCGFPPVNRLHDREQHTCCCMNVCHYTHVWIIQQKGKIV